MTTIPNHPNYLADEQGNIYSARNGTPKKLKPWVQSKTSNYYVLRVEGRKRRYVHQLILETFVGPRPSDRHHAAHVNHNSLDNRLSNLAWVELEDNLHDKRMNGPYSDQIKTAILKAAGVLDVDELALLTQFSSPQVKAICGR